MKWLDILRVRLRLLLRTRDVETRMHDEMRFHVEMEADQLMRDKGLAPDEARRRALAAFGGVEQHKEALRDGRPLAWLSGLSLDVRLAWRMLGKYPGLTLVGGLALAIAIGVGAAWYDLTGKALSPRIPLPEGDRLVSIETHDSRANRPESRVMHDFLVWRSELRTIAELGAFRADTRNLAVDRANPGLIRMTSLTSAAFDAARTPPLLGRGLLAGDDAPGAPSVIVLGYDLWQRQFGGRADAVGSIVRLGDTPTTVVGVMPKGFRYPTNYEAWTPLPVRSAYEPLEGEPISVIGRLKPGATLAQADAELQVLAGRTAADHPASHRHLQSHVRRLGESSADLDAIAVIAMQNFPVLMVIGIACVSVGTLFYARTATRQEEIAVRSALGASRARVIVQLFVEALVLAALAATVGLVAADRAVTWLVDAFGDLPFWATPDLNQSTMAYAFGLALLCAAVLAVLPALRATRVDLQPQLGNRGAGGTLRFGRVWTTAMIAQVTFTAMALPAVMEGAWQVRRQVSARATFSGRQHLAARLDVARHLEHETSEAFDARRTRILAELERRLAQAPGVMAVTFASRVPGTVGGRTQSAQVETPYGARFGVSAIGLEYFEVLSRPIVAGRGFSEGDRDPAARTVIVNEAFRREFARQTNGESVLGVRLRRLPASSPVDDAVPESSVEVVGVVRDLGLDPGEQGDEQPFVFQAAEPAALSPMAVIVRTREDAAVLASQLPGLAADVDADLLVLESQSLEGWIRERDSFMISTQVAAFGVILLTLLLSAMSIYSLVSVSVARRRREIGVRTALGATSRQLLTSIMSRAVVLVACGTAFGGALVLAAVALGLGPSGQPAEDVPQFAVWLSMTAAVVLSACLAACVAPARRALSIAPAEALKDF